MEASPRGLPPPLRDCGSYAPAIDLRIKPNA